MAYVLMKLSPNKYLVGHQVFDKKRDALECVKEYPDPTYKLFKISAKEFDDAFVFGIKPKSIKIIEL